MRDLETKDEQGAADYPYDDVDALYYDEDEYEMDYFHREPLDTDEDFIQEYYSRPYDNITD